MRAVVQRVSSAAVTIEGETVASIGDGLLVLAGCERGDTREDFDWIAGKIAALRIFPGEGESHFERSVTEVGGAVVAVSQFTLLGDCRKGRRPSFSDAMPVEEARGAFEEFLAALLAAGLSVQSGRFQAVMDVASVNHGPVTLLLDSRRRG